MSEKVKYNEWEKKATTRDSPQPIGSHFMNCQFPAHLFRIFHAFFDLCEIEMKLDVDPQRDDDASPMSTYRCMLRPTWMISALQHKSKYKSNPISNFFEKKIILFRFPCCSTREYLSVDVSITYVGLILTKLARAIFFLGIRKLGDGQNSI